LAVRVFLCLWESELDFTLLFTGTFESLLFISCSSSSKSFSKLSSSSSAAIISTSGSLSTSGATPEPTDTLSLVSFSSSLSSAEESELESSYLLNFVDTESFNNKLELDLIWLKIQLTDFQISQEIILFENSIVHVPQNNINFLQTKNHVLVS
jgi:hypothetical protein